LERSACEPRENERRKVRGANECKKTDAPEAPQYLATSGGPLSRVLQHKSVFVIPARSHFFVGRQRMRVGINVTLILDLSEVFSWSRETRNGLQ
jgi:hypothetical protein